MVTPNFSAFCNFAGPILSPAKTKLVLAEIELVSFPPLSSTDFFISSLEKC